MIFFVYYKIMNMNMDFDDYDIDLDRSAIDYGEPPETEEYTDQELESAGDLLENGYDVPDEAEEIRKAENLL